MANKLIHHPCLRLNRRVPRLTTRTITSLVLNRIIVIVTRLTTRTIIALADQDVADLGLDLRLTDRDTTDRDTTGPDLILDLDQSAVQNLTRGPIPRDAAALALPSALVLTVITATTDALKTDAATTDAADPIDLNRIWLRTKN